MSTNPFPGGIAQHIAVVRSHGPGLIGGGETHHSTRNQPVRNLGTGSDGDLAVFLRPVGGEDGAAEGDVGGGLVQVLAGVYGLTVGEAALAQALAAYRDLGAASAAMGITTATARTRLKAVFGKLGVATQVELVSVLANLRDVLGSQGAALGFH